MAPGEHSSMLQPPALTTMEIEERERDGEATGQSDDSQLAPKEWYYSDLDKIVEYISAELTRENPNRYNAPTIPSPPFQVGFQIPPGTHFFLPRHADDGLSSEILHSLMNQDRTPEGLLRLLLLHHVPVERLQVPFSDENRTPEDLCTSFYCPITVERKSATQLFLVLDSLTRRAWITHPVSLLFRSSDNGNLLASTILTSQTYRPRETIRS